jgi:hypothetical protein
MKTNHYSMNVGMNIGTTNEMLPHDHVLRAIKKKFPQTFSTTFIPAHGEFEPTMIAHFHASPLTVHADVHELSDYLQQMAISYRDEDTKQGALAGPKAKEWGSFQPSLFQTV